MPEDTLGLEQHTVSLRPHDRRWNELFEAERGRLQNSLGDGVLAVEHIGSTTVSELYAKPVLDLGVAVEDFGSAFALVPHLEALGYTFRGEQGIPRRHYFVKGPHDHQTHHLHMLERTNPEWRNLILFRDYLLTHSEAAAEYQALKTHLAQKFSTDREAYTEGKHAFIQDVLNRAE